MLSRFPPIVPLTSIITIGVGIFFTRYGIQLLLFKKQWFPRYDAEIRPKLWKIYVKLTSMVCLIYGSYLIIAEINGLIRTEELPFIYFHYILLFFAFFVWVGLKIASIRLYIRYIRQSRKNKEAKDNLT